MKDYAKIKNDLFSIVEIERKRNKYIKLAIILGILTPFIFDFIFIFLIGLTTESCIKIYVLGIILLQYITLIILKYIFLHKDIKYKIEFDMLILFIGIYEIINSFIIINELNKINKEKYDNSIKVLTTKEKCDEIFKECTKNLPSYERYYSNGTSINHIYDTYFKDEPYYLSKTENYYLYRKILKFILSSEKYNDCGKLNSLVDRYIDIIYQLFKDQKILDIDNIEKIETITNSFINTGSKIIKIYNENKTKEKEIRITQYNERINNELNKIILVLNSIEKDLESYN